MYSAPSAWNSLQNSFNVTTWTVSPVPVIVSTPSSCHLFSAVNLSLCFLSLCSSCMFSQVNHRTPFLFYLASLPGFGPLPDSGLLSCLTDHPAWLIILPDWSSCLTLDYFPACLIILPALILNLPALWYLLDWSGFEFCLYTTILLPTPFWINIVRLQLSAFGSRLVPWYLNWKNLSRLVFLNHWWRMLRLIPWPFNVFNWLFYDFVILLWFLWFLLDYL
jgi:hypothetical protein